MCATTGIRELSSRFAAEVMNGRQAGLQLGMDANNTGGVIREMEWPLWLKRFVLVVLVGIVVARITCSKGRTGGRARMETARRDEWCEAGSK